MFTCLLKRENWPVNKWVVTNTQYSVIGGQCSVLVCVCTGLMLYRRQYRSENVTVLEGLQLQ